MFPHERSREGWVSISPKTADWSTPSPDIPNTFAEHGRTMLPLRLCYSWTIWKAQGQTMTGNVAVSLGKFEKEHGLSYTAFSRVTRFENFGILDGVTRQRLCEAVKGHKKVEHRVKEEARLRELCCLTIEKLKNLTS